MVGSQRPLLSRVFDEAKYPTASRVAAAAGAAHGAAYDPDHAYTFGLQRVIDSLGAKSTPAGPDLQPLAPARLRPHCPSGGPVRWGGRRLAVGHGVSGTRTGGASSAISGGSWRSWSSAPDMKRSSRDQ
jgi:hypothetical protein